MSNVTMQQIDAAREKSHAALKSLRYAKCYLCTAGYIEDLEAALATARDEVETLLMQWWAQDCTDRKAP